MDVLNKATDTQAEARFPVAPIAPTPFLVPIASWAQMYEEAKTMRVEFDSFWYDHVYAGVAYFFQWKGAPRSTDLPGILGPFITWRRRTI